MAELVTVSTKGQMTIPKSFRDGLDIRVGDRLVVELLGDTLVVSRAKKALLEYKGFLKSRAASPEADDALAEHIMGSRR